MNIFGLSGRAGGKCDDCPVVGGAGKELSAYHDFVVCCPSCTVF